MSYTYEYPRPAVTVDVAIFSEMHGGTSPQDQVAVLLIRRGREPFKDCWALPGGFVDENESLNVAALRELREETGIGESLELYQVLAVGTPGRDPRGHTISILYTGHFKKPPPAIAGDDAVEFKWVRYSELENYRLAFDHKELIECAYSVWGSL